ncbi:MAG: MurR/RpiR family transcriptional regulator [Erysipelotrichaceae bacterium]
MRTKSIIESFYPTLTKTEKQIADFILHDHDNEIVCLSLSEVSSKLNIGEATIVRFCRKIDFKGYQDLKFAIALDDAKTEEIYDANNYLDIIEKNIVDSIHDTKNIIDMKQLEKGVKMISDAEQLYFYGAGSSAFVAEMAEERFLRVGRRGKSIKESHLQCAQSSICNEKDVIVVISISGSTKDLYEAVHIAKENDCKIITVTNHINSPMAKISDCVLLTSGKENPITGGTMVSMISQMYTLDLLCSGYAMLNAEASYRYKEKVARAINKKLDQK